MMVVMLHWFVEDTPNAFLERANMKLTAEQIEELVERRAQGEGVRVLARQYDISPAYVVRLTKHGYRPLKVQIQLLKSQMDAEGQNE